MAARRVLNETGDPRNIVNGRIMWDKMRRITFTANKLGEKYNAPLVTLMEYIISVINVQYPLILFSYIPINCSFIFTYLRNRRTYIFLLFLIIPTIKIFDMALYLIFLCYSTKMKGTKNFIKAIVGIEKSATYKNCDARSGKFKIIGKPCYQYVMTRSYYLFKCKILIPLKQYLTIAFCLIAYNEYPEYPTGFFVSPNSDQVSLTTIKHRIKYQSSLELNYNSEFSINFEKRMLNKLPFRIYRDDMQLIDEEQVRSMLSWDIHHTCNLAFVLGEIIESFHVYFQLSLGSKNFFLHRILIYTYFPLFPELIAFLAVPPSFHQWDIFISFHRDVFFTGTRLFYRKLLIKMSDYKIVKRNTEQKLSMKQAVHDNINPFLGMAFNEKEELLLLWKFCSRSYIDIYGIADPLERWEKQQAITSDTLKGDDDKSQATQVTSALYEAPEMLKNREKNRMRITYSMYRFALFLSSIDLNLLLSHFLFVVLFFGSCQDF
uniref:Signal transduction histidine kinase n=1 Tax=Heterorhabditis bacteriophora TaxID=37862 RepID=A0A1I7WWP8_HETBA